MFTLLVLAAIALGLMGGGILVLPLLAIGLALWLLTIPIRMIGWLLSGVFHVLGGLLGLVLAPLVLVALALLVVVALIVGLVSLLAPLVPVVLLALLVWAIYHIVSQRPSPTF